MTAEQELEKLRAALVQLTAHLTDRRDEDFADAEKYKDSHYAASGRAYRHVLRQLAFATQGEFGDVS